MVKDLGKIRKIIKHNLMRFNQINEMKLNKEKLIRDLMTMDYDFHNAELELDNLIHWFKLLPEKIILYRIIYVDDINEINTKNIGSHYSIDKDSLIDSNTYVHGYGDMKFLITIETDKSNIDMQETISNNILYPNEKEITLKNKGRGSKIISIDHI